MTRTTTTVSSVAPQIWNPWDVVARHDDLVVVVRPLGDRKGLWQRDHLGDLIVLDADLDHIERRAVLAHELIHAERGIGWGSATAATMAKEEHLVRWETAERLVPGALLERWLREEWCGERIDPAEIAEQFGVPTDVAVQALDRLATRVPDEVARRPGTRSEASTPPLRGT
jgi:hypothetical protein